MSIASRPVRLLREAVSGGYRSRDVEPPRPDERITLPVEKRPAKTDLKRIDRQSAVEDAR